MRITSFMLFKQFTHNLSKNLSKLGSYQQQLSTGKRLTTISDDVVATRGVINYRVSIENTDQFKRNIDEGVSNLGFTENLLTSTQNIINRARELAVGQANDTSTPKTRELTSYEVKNLYSQLLDIGNSKLKNKYVFSGFKTGVPSFAPDGSFQGDSNDIDLYISEGLKTKVNITGDKAFHDDTKLVTGDLTGKTLQGQLKITTGTNNPMIIPVKDGATAASPEEIRDIINSPMTEFYANGAATVGAGELVFNKGKQNETTLLVSDILADPDYYTVSTLVAKINADVAGVEAGIATDDVTGEVRMFFRSTTPGEPVTIDVIDDSDGNDIDTNGISALVRNNFRTNLTENVLEIEAFVLNGNFGKKMLFAPTVPNNSFTIEVDEAFDGSFADAEDIEIAPADGLAMLYHIDDTNTNLSNSVSFFDIMGNFDYALSNNDKAGINGSIYLLDGAMDNLVDVVADVGSKYKYLEEQRDRHDDSNISYTSSRSILEDADIAGVAMQITKVQSSLESLRISSLKSLSQSLMDFLG